VIDPAYAPGVTTPEPFGLKPFDILEFIRTFSSHLIGFDVVEVCPAYDHGETSILAAKLIRSIIGDIWSKS
jgi:arginase family enzyme